MRKAASGQTQAQPKFGGMSGPTHSATMKKFDSGTVDLMGTNTYTEEDLHELAEQARSLRSSTPKSIGCKEYWKRQEVLRENLRNYAFRYSDAYKAVAYNLFESYCDYAFKAQAVDRGGEPQDVGEGNNYKEHIVQCACDSLDLAMEYYLISLRGKW